MTMEKLLSIVTPLYRTPKNFLDDLLYALDPYAEFIELVFVNDSPDDARLKNYLNKIIAKRDYISFYANKKNLGICPSYRVGFENVKGKYCCIVDHDDIFNPMLVIEKIMSCDFDLLYTYEYKIDQNKKVLEYFKKPNFDILSTILYFYTHHVTVFRTDVVKKALLGLNREYTSVFDIDLMLEYLKFYVGKDMNIQKISSYEYAWRVHSKSTAGDVYQKLSGFSERLMKVEEFFKWSGESPIVQLNYEVPYLVEARFYSLYDTFRIPIYGSGDLREWLVKNNGMTSNGFKVISQIEEASDEDLMFLKVILKRVPLYYLRKQRVYNMFIPIRSEYGRLIKNNYEHPSGTVYLSPAEKGLHKSMKGIFISCLSEGKNAVAEDEEQLFLMSGV